MKNVLLVIVGACVGLVTATVVCSTAANSVRWVARTNKK